MTTRLKLSEDCKTMTIRQIADKYGTTYEYMNDKLRSYGLKAVRAIKQQRKRK